MDSTKEPRPRAEEPTEAPPFSTARTSGIPSLAAARPDLAAAEPLSLHRVALRAAVCGPISGLCLAVVATATTPAICRSSKDALELTWFSVVAGAAIVALLTATTELARRARAGLRLPLVAGVGLVAPLLSVMALCWCYFLPRGHEEAARRVLSFAVDVLRHLDDALPAGLAVLVPFALVGAARCGGLPGRLDRPVSRRAQLGLLLAGAAVGCVACVLKYTWRWGEDQQLLAAGFLLGAPALLLGVFAGERLEARLLTWHARRRDEA